MLSLDAGVASAEGGIVYAQQFMKETLEAYKELVKQAAVPLKARKADNKLMKFTFCFK